MFLYKIQVFNKFFTMGVFLMMAVVFFCCVGSFVVRVLFIFNIVICFLKEKQNSNTLKKSSSYILLQTQNKSICACSAKLFTVCSEFANIFFSGNPPLEANSILILHILCIISFRQLILFIICL